MALVLLVNLHEDTFAKSVVDVTSRAPVASPLEINSQPVTVAALRDTCFAPRQIEADAVTPAWSVVIPVLTNVQPVSADTVLVLL